MMFAMSTNLIIVLAVIINVITVILLSRNTGKRLNQGYC